MTVTALGTGGVNSVTWAATTTATRAGVDPAEGGVLVWIGYNATDSGSGAGGTVSNSGWSGTAPTWSTPITVHTAGSASIAMAYSTNAYTGSGSVVATFTSTGDQTTGCAVVELTGATYTFADDATASGASTITLSPAGDVGVAAFHVVSTTDHVWSGFAEVFDSTENAAGGVSRGSFAADESSPTGSPSATPNTGTRCMAGLSFTTTAGGPPAHPSVAYQASGAGAGTETTSADLAAACPATVDPKDALIAHVIYTGTATGPSTPSGWSLLFGPDNLGTVATARHWCFGRYADGSEDGASVSFGTAGGTEGRAARIHSFRGCTAPVGTPITLLTGSFSGIPNATDPQGPTVTTRIKGSIAVALTAQDDNNLEEAIAGMSGGTWANYQEYSNGTWGPQGIVIGVQSCIPTSDPGTVSGGAQVATNDEAGTIGFYIAPYVPLAPVSPRRRQRLRHPLYR